MAYFNSKITMMEGLTYYYEACMSTGDIIGKVARPYHIEFDYQDINGVFHHEHLEDFKARFFCHEVDHLKGQMYVSLVEGELMDATEEEEEE